MRTSRRSQSILHGYKMLFSAPGSIPKQRAPPSLPVIVHPTRSSAAARQSGREMWALFLVDAAARRGARMPLQSGRLGARRDGSRLDTESLESVRATSQT